MKEQLKKADLLGLVIIASALVAYFIRSVWTTYQTVAVAAGAALVLISLVLKSSEIRTGLGRRSTRFGINSAISVLLFVGILGLVNYLGAQHPKRFDMTTESLNSLSDQSVQAAGQVQEDLKITAFYLGGEDATTRKILDLYANQNSRISVEFVDPDKQNQLAEKYQVTSYGVNPLTGQASGTIVLEMAGKTERIEKQGPVIEEDVTNALLKLVKGETKTIYFTEGHGEKAIANVERTGYQVATKDLEKAGYVVKPLNLIVQGGVPEDAAAVVIAGPTTEPFAQEVEFVDAYLNKGGSVLLMLDPPPAASMADLAKKWSVDVGSNRVIDPVSRLFGAEPDVPLVSEYRPHKITERFNVMTFFPQTRSVKPAEPAVEGVIAEPLLESSEESWGESDLQGLKVTRDANDLKGPVSLATVVNKDVDEGKKARLIVIGDSDFARNELFNLQGNGNLFTNVVRWLVQDESFISIAVKNPEDRPINMTESQGQLVMYTVLLFFPGAIVAAGVFVWAKRRR